MSELTVKSADDEKDEKKPAIGAHSTLLSENVHFGSQSLSKSGREHEQTHSISRRKLGSSRRHKGGQNVKDSDIETHNKPIQEFEEDTSIKLSETSDLTITEVHSASNADQKVSDKLLIQDDTLSSRFSTTDTKSRKRDETTEQLRQDRNLHVSFMASELHLYPVTPEIHSEKRTRRDNTIHEEKVEKASPSSYTNESPQHAEDAVKKAQEEEAEPEHRQGIFQIQYTAERERGGAAEKTEKISRTSLNLTENKEMSGHLSSDTDFLITLEGTTDKTNKNHNEIEYSVEQQAYSSPQDKLSTTGEEDKTTSISKTAETHHSKETMNKEPTGQINLQVQEMLQIDFTSLLQNKSGVQTLQSDANVALGFHHQDNYQSNKHDIHSGLKTETGSRKKLGSSRRNKGKQHVKFTEANQDHEEGDDENTENYEARQMCATREEELEHFKSIEKLEPIVAEDEKTEKLQEEKSFFSPNSLGDSTVSTSEIHSSSNKEDFLESNKNSKEKINKLLHEPESLSKVTEYGKDKISLIQSPQAFVSEGDSDMQSILKHDDIINPMLGSVSVLDQDKAFQSQNREVRTPGQEVQLQQTRRGTETERCLTSEDHGREVVSSIDAQDPRLDEEEENSLRVDQEVNTSPEFITASVEPTMDVSYKNGRLTTMDANKSHQEETVSDSSESLQEISKLKKRKIGSSRRTQINRKQEEETPKRDKTKEFDINAEDEMKNLETIEAVEEIPSMKAVVQSENVQLSDDALVQQETSEAKIYDEHQQVQDVTEQNVNEEISSQTLEIKSTDLNSASRQRKMGSTRKNLGSQAKRENLHEEEELEIQAAESETTTGDATRESILEIKGPQLHSEYQDSDRRTEKVFVEISHFGGSLLKPLAEETPEESPVSQSHVVEAEQTPHFPPSSSPQNDSVSESATGGKRKKFGSNRKSHSQQKNKKHNEREEGATETQNEDDARGIIEGAHKAAAESPDLEKISEVHENGDKASSETTELSKPVSEKTQSKSYLEDIRLSAERDRQFPLGSLRGTGSSNSYNVVMIGDSSVGKTSFMKRAQSGKFSLDSPASVGLDTCLWTVVVDGKPVVLQIWDTAGQERFHSITRQVFHRAEAFLLMYDITCSQSFSAVGYWANCIQESAAENVTILLLGNKSDDEQRQVKTEQGDSLAKEYNFAFMECSAATGENVIEALETVARMLSQRFDTREETTELHKQPAPKKQSKCC